MGVVTLTEAVPGVSLLTIDRPPVNAMNVELLEELVAAVAGVAAAPPRALVLCGRAGCFSAGADLKRVPGYGAAAQRRMVAGINAMAVGVYGLEIPVVAAITGHAIAGGMVLALTCDHRIAAREGRYGLTEVRVGVPYPQAAIGVVRAELGADAARRLALRADLVGAEECVRLGVFDEVLSAVDVPARAVALASELAAVPGDVYARTKRDLRAGALREMRARAAADPLLSRWMQAGAEGAL